MAKDVEATPALEFKPCLHVDFDKNASEVKGMAVGEKVRLVIVGTVKGVEQRESYDDPKKMMASVSLKDFTVKVASPGKDWAEEFDD